jgi:hypothetical protein
MIFMGSHFRPHSSPYHLVAQVYRSDICSGGYMWTNSSPQMCIRTSWNQMSICRSRWCNGHLACYWTRRSRVQTRPRAVYFRDYKIHSGRSLGVGGVKPSAPCRNILRHVKEPWRNEHTYLQEKLTDISCQVSPSFATRCLLQPAGNSSGWIRNGIGNLHNAYFFLMFTLSWVWRLVVSKLRNDETPLRENLRQHQHHTNSRENKSRHSSVQVQK